MTRALTGHPEDMKMPPAPVLPPGPWVWVGRRHEHRLRRTVGHQLHREPHARSRDRPRQVDRGDVHRDDADRTARGQGTAAAAADARIRSCRALEDEDIKSVFAYLQSLTPVKNRVPAPVDPPEEKK